MIFLKKNRILNLVLQLYLFELSSFWNKNPTSDYLKCTFMKIINHYVRKYAIEFTHTAC